MYIAICNRPYTVRLIAGQVTLRTYGHAVLSHMTHDDWWFYYEKYSSARQRIHSQDWTLGFKFFVQWFPL